VQNRQLPLGPVLYLKTVFRAIRNSIAVTSAVQIAPVLNLHEFSVFLFSATLKANNGLSPRAGMAIAMTNRSSAQGITGVALPFRVTA